MIHNSESHRTRRTHGCRKPRIKVSTMFQTSKYSQVKILILVIRSTSRPMNSHCGLGIRSTTLCSPCYCASCMLCKYRRMTKCLLPMMPSAAHTVTTHQCHVKLAFCVNTESYRSPSQSCLRSAIFSFVSYW